MKYPLDSLRHFQRDEGGNLTAETLIVLPVLLWWWVASIVYFDAYQTRNIGQKAAYTLSDAVSREMGYEPINQAYIDGLADLFSYLTKEKTSRTRIRVTQFYCEKECDFGNPARALKVDWSSSTGTLTALNDQSLAGYQDKIPVIAQGDRMVMVETIMDYTPIFNVGLTETSFNHLILTRLRFSPQLCWENCNTS